MHFAEAEKKTHKTLCYVSYLRTFVLDWLWDLFTFSHVISSQKASICVYLEKKLKIQGLLNFLAMIIITKQDSTVVLYFYFSHGFCVFILEHFFFKGRFNLSHTAQLLSVCVGVCRWVCLRASTQTSTHIHSLDDVWPSSAPSYRSTGQQIFLCCISYVTT